MMLVKKLAKVFATELVLVFFALSWPITASAETPSTPHVDFGCDVAPIFSQFCVKCHSGDSPQGQLRLDTRESAMTGGVSGAGIVPGDLQKSLIYQRVTSDDSDS